MKISGKKGYYSFVICIGLFSILLSFLNLNFHNKYPNKITVQNTLHRYLNILNGKNKFSKDSIFANYTFPFKISFNSDKNSKQFDMKYNEEKNIISLFNFDSLSKEYQEEVFNLFSKFSIVKNLTTHLNLTKVDIPSNIPIYRHINMYIMVNEKENLTNYRKYILKFEMLYRMKLQKSGLNLFLKFIYYNSTNGVIDNKSLYKDVSSLNSRVLMEELNDKDNLNIILWNTSTPGSYLNYNEDIKSIILKINFENEKEFNPSFLHKALAISGMRNVLNLQQLNSSPLISTNLLTEMIKVVNSKHFKYHSLLMISLSNLSKINRIFPLYESIKTIKPVTEKVNIIIYYISFRLTKRPLYSIK